MSHCRSGRAPRANQLPLEPRSGLSDHAAGQKQQRATVEQSKNQLTVFGVGSEILRYPDEQNGTYHGPPERSDSSDDEDRHQLDHDAKVEKRAVDVIQEVRVEAARKRGVDGTKDEYLDPAANDIHTQSSRRGFVRAERTQGAAETRIHNSEREQEQHDRDAPDEVVHLEFGIEAKPKDGEVRHARNTGQAAGDFSPARADDDHDLTKSQRNHCEVMSSYAQNGRAHDERHQSGAGGSGDHGRQRRPFITNRQNSGSIRAYRHERVMPE